MHVSPSWLVPGSGVGWGAESAQSPHYYTPLPLNLANNNNKQQNVIMPFWPLSPRFGAFANLAIFEPRWWPCQIQVLAQKLNGGAPERWLQVGRCPPKTAHFLPQNSLFFGPKRGGLGPNSLCTKNGPTVCAPL